MDNEQAKNVAERIAVLFGTVKKADVVPYVDGDGREGLQVTFVGGRTVFVLPASLIQSFKKRRLMQSAIDTATGDVDIDSLRTFFIPSLIASSTGQVPTEDEIINLRNGLTEEDINAWYLAVEQTNPHWFPDVAEKKIESADTPVTRTPKKIQKSRRRKKA